MSLPTATTRRAVLQELATRTARPVPIAGNGHGAGNGNGNGAGSGNGGGQPATSTYFGCNTFGARQMRDRLPKAVAKSLFACIRQGKKLDREIAPVVAQVIKEWAMSQGATHFSHWFLPQTGLTAEKHRRVRRLRASPALPRHPLPLR